MCWRLEYTLVGDGASDRCLQRVIDWLLRDSLRGQQVTLLPQVADPRVLRRPPRTLVERLRWAYGDFGGDLVFVHRDAERGSRETRVAEIDQAARGAGIPAHVAIVPVRMTEAWLLIDEAAIRRAAGNPTNSDRLPLPERRQLERVPDPKRMLEECLKRASNLHGRRLRRFARDLPERKRRVAELIDDYTPLRDLPAFAAFERDTRAALAACRPRD